MLRSRPIGTGRRIFDVAQMERLSEAFRHVVLRVCSTAEHRDGLRLRAKRPRSCALFPSLAEALNLLHEATWIK